MTPAPAHWRESRTPEDSPYHMDLNPERAWAAGWNGCASEAAAELDSLRAENTRLEAGWLVVDAACIWADAHHLAYPAECSNLRVAVAAYRNRNNAGAAGVSAVSQEGPPE